MSKLIVNCLEAQAKVICDNLGITYKPANADLTLAIDGQVIGLDEAENINGRWYINIPQLGLNKASIRDVLQGLGYIVGWEESNKVIIATK